MKAQLEMKYLFASLFLVALCKILADLPIKRSLQCILNTEKGAGRYLSSFRNGKPYTSTIVAACSVPKLTTTRTNATMGVRTYIVSFYEHQEFF